MAQILDISVGRKIIQHKAKLDRCRARYENAVVSCDASPLKILYRGILVIYHQKRLAELNQVREEIWFR